jgi:hypothetical protein
MYRLALTAILFILAATAQALRPAHQGPNGSAHCPETQPLTATEEADASRSPNAESAAVPAAVPVKAAAARPKAPGARWHSFLPGMFK